jgi:hypothetical protein
MTEKDWADVQRRLQGLWIKRPPNSDRITVGLESGEEIEGSWAPFAAGKTRDHASTTLIEVYPDDRRVFVIDVAAISWLAYERAPLLSPEAREADRTAAARIANGGDDDDLGTGSPIR